MSQPERFTSWAPNAMGQSAVAGYAGVITVLASTMRPHNRITMTLDQVVDTLAYSREEIEAEWQAMVELGVLLQVASKTGKRKLWVLNPHHVWVGEPNTPAHREMRDSVPPPKVFERADG